MPLPTMLHPARRDETYAGLTYHIEGDLVPALHIELGQEPVYFEHYILLWKEPCVEISLHPLKGAFKRMVAGMPLLMTQAEGPGSIAFSRDGAGQVFALHLRRGEGVDVREHQWLAATDNMEYSFRRVKGFANLLLGGSGFFIDSFNCQHRDGIIWLHGYGNVFEVELEDGEQIDVEPGGWIYMDQSVNMETIFQKVSSGLFASTQIFWNRFTGPGKIGLQTMYMPMETSE